MRDQLDELDEYTQSLAACDPETSDGPEFPIISESDPPGVKAKLGSSQGDQTFARIGELHGTDRAFTNFRVKLNHFLNKFLHDNNIPLPGGKRIQFLDLDTVSELFYALMKRNDQFWFKVVEFRYLQVKYESKVDWRLHRDLLRCNPNFFGSPRYDCVMVETEDKPFFARLIYMFSCSIDGTDFPLALVHPYDVGVGVRRRHDMDLGLWRVRAKPRSSSEIISIHSITRGAALANDPDTFGDYFVIHTIDADMFLRVKSLEAQLS
jgi:hypothetical protein